MQDRQDGKETMQGLALTRFIHRIIREYGKYSHNNYSVDVNNLDLADKKLVISHFESAEWYEWACESESRVNELFKESATYFQELVDNECYPLYCDDMEEAGVTRCTYPSQDEVYWVRSSV
jgi:hypothetical protein